MTSRRTGWSIWGILPLPIFFLNAIKTFEFPFFYFSGWHTANPEKGVLNSLTFISFLLGSLSALLLPFSLIRHYCPGKRNLG